jgi:HEAT repeat protein
MHRQRFWSAALISVALAQLTTPGFAQGADKPKTDTKAKPKPEAKPDAKGKGKEKVKLDLPKLKGDLESSDASRILAALDELQKAGDGGAAAAPLVDALLKRGSSQPVIEKALETEGALKQPASSAAVAPYVKHRAPEVRRAATKALIKTKGPEAVKALKLALRSPDAPVRGIAATGLGTLAAKDALGDLFNALAHGVAESASAIGQLCEPKDCEKFAELTGKHQFDVMSSGFDQILFRNEKEMPEDQKIKIVGRLRELGTNESGKYLAEVKGRWPDGWSKRVKQAIDAAVRATGGTTGED